MKIQRFLYTFLISSSLLFSCTDDFEEINTNPTSPAQVPGDFLFTNTQWSSHQQGFWVYSVLMVGNWIQHNGNQNSGFSMAHYLDRGQDYAGYWNNHYLLLFDLQKAVEEIDAQEDPGEFSNVKKAIIEILAVEIWYYFTQMVGDVPYTQALLPEEFTSPVYDAQEVIIPDLFNRLEAAINVLRGSSVAAFGGADVYYGGDPQQWVKYGNSLMLKMALGIEDGDAGLASERASLAMQGPLLESTDDNAVLPTDNAGPAFRHPMWSLDNNATSDRPFLGEFFVNLLIDTDDPRLPIIAAPTVRSLGGTLEYRGVPAAPDDALYADINANLDNFSHANADWFSGSTTNYNKGINRMTFAEVSFYKAEAVLKGYGSGDAQQFFEEGIRAAMTVPPFSDAGVTEAQIDAYIAANGTLMGSVDEQLEQVVTQNYIQHFMDQTFDVFLDWRRTGFPQITPGPNPGETGGVIPRRYKYSENEVVLNEANYNAAVSDLSQGDSYLSRVWTDPQ